MESFDNLICCCRYMEKAGLPLRADCSLQEFKELVGVPHCHT